MRTEELLELVTYAAKGFNIIERGVVGSNGYGFLFQDPNNSPFKTSYSSKIFSLNLDIIQLWEFKKHSRKDILNYMDNEEKQNMLIAGRIKTLCPTLKFGGHEILFEVWMFVRIPDERCFPATLYYGPSGLGLGGWKSFEDDSGEKIFPPDFESIINYNPFDLSKNELIQLVDALNNALNIVPISDFYGMYVHDFGQSLMGVKFGRPFIRELHEPLSEERLKRVYKSIIV
jgi:hypothetical protein